MIARVDGNVASFASDLKGNRRRWIVTRAHLGIVSRSRELMSQDSVGREGTVPAGLCFSLLFLFYIFPPSPSILLPFHLFNIIIYIYVPLRDGFPVDGPFGPGKREALKKSSTYSFFRLGALGPNKNGEGEKSIS